MPKIFNKVVATTMLIAVLFSYLISPVPVKAAQKEAETLGELKQQLADLKRQKSQNDANKQQTQAQINANKQAIANANQQITEAENQITEAEEEIEESNQKIADIKETTKNSLRFLQQMKSQNSYLAFISEANSMTEMIMRINAIEQLNDYNQKKFKELEQLIKDNEQLKVDLKRKQSELSSKIANYNKVIQNLYGSMEEYDEFALDIDTQIKTMQTSVNSYIKLCASSSKSYLGDNELLSDCTNVPYNAGWLKPLNSGRVTSPWGYRTDPLTGAQYSFHNGIDIGGNPEGTKVMAAAAGVVAGIVWRYSCGGNMVYVNVTVGGKKYTTWYYHLLTVNVSVGQVVTQSTVIGTVGGYSTSRSHGGYDSCTTGAHLHFGVETGHYSYVVKNNIITPPGFNNSIGYSFKSRTDYYG